MRCLPLALALLLPFAAAGQQPPAQVQDAVPPSAVTTGFMHALHATNNVDHTLAFYTTLFGIEGKVTPFENPNVQYLTDAPGVKLRIAMIRLPGRGFNFELTEFTNVPRTPAQPSVVDSGAPHMKILVRDLAPVLAGADTLHSTVVTRSSAPVRVRSSLGEVEAIFLRDPDGYLVEVIQVPAGSAPARDANVVGAIMGVTVADLNASIKFWHDELGFDFEVDEGYSSDATVLDLYGIKGNNISYRTARGAVPGSNARLEFIEFRGVPRNSFSLRAVDPGASGMAMRVNEIETLVPALKAKGVPVISANQKVVEWTETVRNVFVKDPNGLNLELVGTAATMAHN
jgi:catechol 2,3-dioxygenase-like lactoylglutathione lyase family enzyme